MSSAPLAHSPNPNGLTHDLATHLHEVARWAACFAAPFDTAGFAECAGLWHDLGKNALDFQARIAPTAPNAGDAHLEAPNVPGRVDHSSAGAIHALQRLGRGLGLPLAFVIAGHHAGLADQTDLDSRLAQKQPRLDAALANPSAVVPQPKSPVPPAFLRNTVGTSGDQLKRSYEFWVRMLFSCLVDADFLDTERHFDGKKAGQRGDRASLQELKARFDKHMAEKKPASSGQQSHVNRIRDAVLQECRAAGAGPQGVFTLTGPTGCGKTLAGMGFALEHALRHGLQRVIVVIPYTSIIDQNAHVYREVFGPENVIDHHASIDPKKETPRNRIAAENWDAPIIVTTSVQFMESLLANRTSKCRKLHNVANSVVLFDEVQTLPIEHLIPIVDLLQELVRNYRVSLVLSTATQPALKRRVSGLSWVFPGFENVTEIVQDVPGTFASLRRVDVHFPTDLTTPVTWENLAAEVKSNSNDVLVVVHRRDDARDLARLLPASLHLSALMCPVHRLEVIDNIKARLEQNRAGRAQGKQVAPLRVVSTQLVEAGVDLDFPVVYRALAGFDSIAQAAGRCNREGRLQGHLGEVRVFVAPTKPPRGTLADGLAVARAMLAAEPGINPLDPAIFDAYFRRLYFGRNLDEAAIQALRIACKFKTVSETFRMIQENESEPVVVPYGDALQRLNDLRNYGPNRQRLRALQPFIVTVYSKHLKELEAAGAVEWVAETVRAIPGTTHSQLYNGTFGLKSEPPFPVNPGAMVQ